ncbi:MAG: phospholipase D family protein [Gammaproteobacteria bacterium]
MSRRPGSRLLILLLVALLAGCSGRPVRQPEPVAAAPPQGVSELERWANRQAGKHPGRSGILLLGSGTNALDARLSLIDHARRTLDVQYYLIRDDESGKRFLWHLQSAAKRGVRVRLLLDDIHLPLRERLLARLDAHPNVSVRVFNPFDRNMLRLPQLILRFSTLNRRMHNKVLIADGAFAISGSRNIGDEYFEVKPTLTFGDLDVLAAGPLVSEMSRLFDRFWHYPASRAYAELNPRTDPAGAELARVAAPDHRDIAGELLAGQTRLEWKRASLVADNPEKIESRSRQGDFLDATGLRPHSEKLADQLLIITPYFVPGEEGVRYFRALRERGIAVTIFTNSFASTDVQLVHSAYRKYRARLLAMGVEIYELKQLKQHLRIMEKLRRLREHRAGSRASLHAKVIVYDRERLYIGSMNADPRSIHHNTEMGVLVESPGQAEAIVDWFLENRADIAYRLELGGEEGKGRITWNDTALQRAMPAEPNMNSFQMLWIGFLSLLPGESQL